MTQISDSDNIEWHLTTWEGARREAMRRWAALPLERIIAALEEMQKTSEMFAKDGNAAEAKPM